MKRLSLWTFAIAAPLAVVFTQAWSRYSLIALTCASIVCLSFFVDWKSRFLRYTGRISYGLYLIHMGVFGLVNKLAFRDRFKHRPILNDLAYLFVGFAVTYGVATFSWRYFESRILVFKRYFEPVRALRVPASEGVDPTDTSIEPVG